MDCVSNIAEDQSQLREPFNCSAVVIGLDDETETQQVHCARRNGVFKLRVGQNKHH